MRRIRSKLIPGTTEGGESDVGPEGLAKGVPGGVAREDVAQSIVNPPAGSPETKGIS